MIDILTGKMELHISADIAYAVWQYWRATGDDGFFLDAGAEILLETARFWATRAEAEADGKRHIRHIIGPDEYHEDVDDNAFTNVMARWNIARALEAIQILRARWPDRAAALCEKLALGDQELADWHDAAARIVTGLDPATGLYEQFAGYHQLEPLDLSLYADRKVPIDVVIGRERTQRSQVVKQADVVALLALLPDEFPGAAAKANFRHYEPRCAHGSSLSAGIHALVAARLGETETALRFLRQAAAADLEFDPNSAGGIRIAGLGGVWQAVVLGFAGLDLAGEAISLNPRLPPAWRSMSFTVRWRGRAVQVRIAGGPCASRCLMAKLWTSASPANTSLAGRDCVGSALLDQGRGCGVIAQSATDELSAGTPSRDGKPEQSWAVLDKMAAIQMVDVHLPTHDGRTVILSRYTEPESGPSHLAPAL